MKNKPLSVQIWMVIAGITLSISLLFLAIVPWTLRGFFTRQMYDTIRESQDMFLSGGRLIKIDDLVKWDQLNQQYRSVKHLVVLDNGQVLWGLPSVPVQQNLNGILSQARSQTGIQAQYWRQIENERMYYVIRKGDLAGQPAYLLSYMWESYQNDLVNTLFRRLLWVISALLLLSWIPSFWLARHLTRPLISMEQQVRRIAARDWDEPLITNRHDEIGQLGQSIERMREQLIKQDKAQHTFLQHISHELKTPIMVIRSYAQAIADGIFPRGGLEGSVAVIDEEAERLQRRVKDLLYLTKLDQLSVGKASAADINIEELVKHVVELMRWQRTDLEWKVQVEPIMFKGDADQWKIALENLLDNQIRYAAGRICISSSRQIKNGKSGLTLRIANDGPPIEEKLLNSLFMEYEKGFKGQFGLGLAIVQQIAVSHGARVWAANEDESPAFYIELEI
jgi:two-component system sensor histidine kinase CssS